MAEESNMALRPMNHRATTTTTTSTSTTTTATTTITAITTTTTYTTTTTAATAENRCSVHSGKGNDSGCDVGLESACSFIGFELDSRPARLVSDLRQILVKTGSVPRKRGRKRSQSDANGVIWNGEPAILPSLSENVESRSLTSLEKVFIEETNMKNVDAKGLTSLEEVFIHESNLENAGTKGFPSLAKVIIDETNLKNVGAKGFTSLEKVIIKETNLESAGTKGFASLGKVIIDKTNLENVDAMRFTSLGKVIIEETNLENAGTKRFGSLGKAIINETNLENVGAKEFTSQGKVVIEEMNLEYTVKQKEHCVSVRRKGSGVSIEEVNVLDKSCPEVEDLCFISLCDEGQEDGGEETSDIIILKELLSDKSSFLHGGPVMAVSCIEEETDPVQLEKRARKAVKKETEDHKTTENQKATEKNCKQTENPKKPTEDHKATGNCKKTTQNHKETEEDQDKEDYKLTENHKATESHKERENQIENRTETKDHKQDTENHQRRESQKETKEDHQETEDHMEIENQIKNHEETEDYKPTGNHKETEPANSPLIGKNTSPGMVPMQQNDNYDIYTLDQLVEVEQEGQYHLYGAPEYIEEVITVEDSEDTLEEHQSTLSSPVSFITMDHSYSQLPVRCLKDTFTPKVEERSRKAESCETEAEEMVLEEQAPEIKSCETEGQEMDLGDSIASEDSDMKGLGAKRSCIGESESVSSYQSDKTESEGSQKSQETKSLCVGESKAVSSYQSENTGSEDSQKGQEADSTCVGESKAVFSYQIENTGSEASQKDREAKSPCVGESRPVSSHQSENTGSEECQKSCEAKSSFVKVAKAAYFHQSDNIASENSCMGKLESVSSHKSERDARDVSDFGKTTTAVVHTPETTTPLSSPSGAANDGFRNAVRATKSVSYARDITNTTNATTSVARHPETTTTLSVRSSTVTEDLKNAVRATRSNSSAKDITKTTTTATGVTHHPETTTTLSLQSVAVMEDFKNAVRATRSRAGVADVLNTSRTTTAVIHSPKTTAALSSPTGALIDSFKNALPDTTSSSIYSVTSPSVCSTSIRASKGLQSTARDHSVLFPTQGNTDISGGQNETQEVLDSDEVVLDADRVVLSSGKLILEAEKEVMECNKVVLDSEGVVTSEHQESNENHSSNSSTLESENKSAKKPFHDHQTGSSERLSCSNSKCSPHSGTEGNVVSPDEGRNTEGNYRLCCEGQRAESQERTTIRSSIQLRKRKVYKLIEVPQRESINYDMISDLDSNYMKDTSPLGDSAAKDKWLEAIPDLFPTSKAEKKAINKIWQVLTTQLENCMKGITTLPPPVCVRSKKRKRNIRGRGSKGGEESKNVTPQIKNKDAVCESSRTVPETPDSRISKSIEAKKESDPLLCSEKVPMPKRKSVCFCRYNTVLPLASRRTCCGRKRFKSGCRRSSRGSSREDTAYPTDKSLYFNSLGLMEKSQYDKDVYYKSLVTHRTRKVRAHQNRGKAHYRMFLDNLHGFCLDQNSEKLKQPLPLRFISEHKLCKLSTKGKPDGKVRTVDWIIDKCVDDHNFEGFVKAVSSKTCSTRKMLSLQASSVRLAGLESLPSHSEALSPVPFCCTDTNDNFTENFNLPKESGQLQSSLKSTTSDVEQCSVCEKSSDGLCSKNCSLRKESEQSQLPLKINTSDVQKCSVCEKSSDGLCSESCRVQKESTKLQSSLRSNTLDVEKCRVCEKSSDGVCSVEHEPHTEATPVRICKLHSKTGQSNLVTQDGELVSLRGEKRVERTDVVDNEEAHGQNSRLRNGGKGECTAEVGNDFSVRKRRKIDYGVDTEGEDFNLKKGKQAKCATEVDEDFRMREGRKDECARESENEDISLRGEKTLECAVGGDVKAFNLNGKNVKTTMDLDREDFRLLDTYSISEEEFSSLEEDSRMEGTDEEVSTNTSTQGLSLKQTELDMNDDSSSNSFLPDLWSVSEKDVPSIHQALSTMVESPPQSDDSPMGSVVTLEQLRGLPTHFDNKNEDCDFLGFDDKPSYFSYEAISPLHVYGKDASAVSPGTEVMDEFLEGCEYFEPHKPLDSQSHASVTPKMPAAKKEGVNLNIRKLDTEEQVRIKLPKINMIDYTIWGRKNEVTGNSIVDFQLRPEDLALGTKGITHLSLKGTKALKLPASSMLVSPQKKRSTEMIVPEMDLTRSCRVNLMKIQIPESGLDGIKIGAEGSLDSSIFSNTNLSPKKLMKSPKRSERESETCITSPESSEDSLGDSFFSSMNLSLKKLTKSMKRSERETETCATLSRSSEAGTGSLKGVKRGERQPETCITVSRSSERQNVRRIKYSELLKPGVRRSLNGLCSKERPTLAQTARRARSASDGVVLKCTTCSLLFRNKAALNTHLETHKVKKEHECVECGLKFAEKANFESHVRLHSSARQLVSCEKCGACFSQLEDLRSHVKSHLSPKSQNCGITCKYETTISDALDADLKEGEGNCLPCSGTFVVSPTLRRHTRMFRRGKVHHCALCKVDTSPQNN